MKKKNERKKKNEWKKEKIFIKMINILFNLRLYMLYYVNLKYIYYKINEII